MENTRGREVLEGTDDQESMEELYSPDYLRDCASDGAREERLQELKRRIELGAYRVDADTVARELLSRGDLDAE